MHAADPGAEGRPGPGRLAWFDVSAGVPGDMLCGSLVDAGVPLAVLQDAVDTVVPGRIRFARDEVARAGLTATAVTPHLDGDDRTERAWGDLRQLLLTAALAGPVQERAIDVFSRLAKAEAGIHGVAVDDVHLHELGGLDALADVVGVVAGLHHLGIDEVVAGPMAVGSGTVRAAHGVLPVPVPAVVRLCRGWQVESGGTGELATPTGAALVTTLARACLPLPAMTLEANGTGAGSRDTPGRANVVRVLIGTRTGETATTDEATSTQVALEATRWPPSSRAPPPSPSTPSADPCPPRRRRDHRADCSPDDARPPPRAGTRTSWARPPTESRCTGRARSFVGIGSVEIGTVTLAMTGALAAVCKRFARVGSRLVGPRSPVPGTEV